MVQFDPDKSAGWWIFKLPKNDPYQKGADEHDDDAERKARGLPTRLSRSAGNDALEDAWEGELEHEVLRPGQDKFARGYEAVRQKLFRVVIWIFQVPMRGWRNGRITTCSLDERKGCICQRDGGQYGNRP